MEILFVPDKTPPKNYSSLGTSLVVEALKLCLPTQAKSPGWDTKIPHALRPKSQNIKQRENHYKVKEDFFKNGPHHGTYIPWNITQPFKTMK